MDGAAVAALAQVIDDKENQRINAVTAKRKISAILHRKSVKRVVQELNEYVALLPAKEKGQAVLIVIMALLRLVSNPVPILAQEIQKYPLAELLHGGLAMLLSGRNQSFSFRLTWMHRSSENIYEIIKNWEGDYFWNYSEVFLAAKLLYEIQPDRLERLALEDKSGVILLSMVHCYLNVRPSDTLLQKLLQSTDPLHPNFALAFYTGSVSFLCDKVGRGTVKRKEIKELRTGIGRCLAAFDVCSPKLRTELLTNYVLVHQNAFPEAFARQLVGEELQEEFVYQITESGKVRTIRELAFIARLIAETPACNREGHRISKKPLSDAVLRVLMRLIQARRIYPGDAQWQNDIETVLQALTVRQRERLRRFLKDQDKRLMVGALDQLVRYRIYLEDIQQHQVLQGIQDRLK